MIYSLLADEAIESVEHDPALAKTVYTVIGIIVAVIVAIVLVVLLIKKVIIPKIEDKKIEERLNVKRQKEQELNKIWLANYQKINSALKTVFYAGLVDSWKNIQDMLAYQVKDTCPYCGGKLIEVKGDWKDTTSMQLSASGQSVYTDRGLAYVYTRKERPDGGYEWKKPTVCEKCNRTLFVYSESHIATYDSKTQNEYWSNDESKQFTGIEWRNPHIEAALGKELCNYIDLNGHFRPATLSHNSSKERKYSSVTSNLY